MVAVSKAWRKLFHRGKDTRNTAVAKVTPPQLTWVRYGETHGPSGRPRISPNERASRKAKRTAEKQARRSNRKAKATNRRRSRPRKGGGSS
jgi:hypothetical protein